MTSLLKTCVINLRIGISGNPAVKHLNDHQLRRRESSPQQLCSTMEFMCFTNLFLNKNRLPETNTSCINFLFFSFTIFVSSFFKIYFFFLRVYEPSKMKHRIEYLFCKLRAIQITNHVRGVWALLYTILNLVTINFM